MVNKVYIINFDSNEEMKKFAASPPDGTRVRCIFNKKNAISVEASKVGFCKIISEGLMPDEKISSATDNDEKSA